MVVLPSLSKEVILERSASFKPPALLMVSENGLKFHACIIELDGCLDTNIKMLPYNVNKVSNKIFRELNNTFDSLLLN